MKHVRSRPHRRLEVSRETLRALSTRELSPVAGGAPSKGPNCGFSEPSLCATCLCTV